LDAPTNGRIAQYRADFSDAVTYSPLEPLYDDLASAQERCETDLRSAWPDGAEAGDHMAAGRVLLLVEDDGPHSADARAGARWLLGHGGRL
jgi:hypothetical protein